MPNIYDYATGFRSDLEAGANEANLTMIRLYAELWSERIKPQLDGVMQEIEDDIAAGKDPALARQAKRARMLRIQEDLRIEMARIQARVGQIIDQEVRSAVDKAQLHASDLMRAGLAPPPGMTLASFNRLPASALENLVGVLQEGSPLKRLLDDVGTTTATDVGKALLQGLALGKNPREMARNARAALGGNMARALTIARTESLRAYREASRQTYAHNPAIVRRWMWLCAKQVRTCAVCWASNGQEFPIAEPMPTHPNCRCTMVPVTVTWADYAAEQGIPTPPGGWPGGPDLDRLVGDGPSLFDKLPEDAKRKILGHSKYEHYKAGAFGLRDLIATTRDPDWGRSRHEKSLQELGLDRLPSGKTVPKPAPSEAEAVRKQIAELNDQAWQTIRDLNDQVAALEAQYQELMAEYNKLMNISWGIGGAPLRDLTEAEQRQLEWLRQQRKEYLDVITNAQDKARTEANTLAARQRALLYVNNPAGVVPKGTKNALSRHKGGISEFNRLVDASTIDPSFRYAHPNIQSRLSNSGRSYYDNNGGIMMQRDSDRVTVHELGHWWEHQNPAAHQAVLDFLDRRTAGENPQWLGPGYGRHEVARPDNFIHPYIGKDYTDRQGTRYATEVVSMGLEYFHSDPHNFATNDPDMFDFIFNLVRGKY